jgi:hypothetical protein
MVAYLCTMITQAEAKANWASMGPVLAQEYFIGQQREHSKEDVDDLSAYLSASLGMIGEKLYVDAKLSSDGPISEMQEPFKEMFESVRDAFLELIASFGARPE